MEVQNCKKNKSNASLVLNVHPEIEDDKLNITNTSDMKDESRTQFWNKIMNKNNLNRKQEEKDNKNELDLELEKSRIISLKGLKKEIKQNKKRKNKLYKIYKNKSKSSSKKQQKFAQKLEKEVIKSSDIRAL